MKNITFEEMKKIIDEKYDINNFPVKDKYLIEVNYRDFELILNGLKLKYNAILFGRKKCKKGFDVNLMEIKFSDP